MKRLSLIFVLALCAASCSNAPKEKFDPVVEQYFKDSLDVLSARCQEVLDAAYMCGTLLGENKEIPGWEGYPCQLWEYYTGVDKYTGVPKRGLVYLLMPSPEKLAKWIVNAVYDATGELSFDNIERIRKFIQWQSGAQFAVRGVVYEDMYEKDFHEPYVFKDGITVYVSDSTYVATKDKNFKTCTDEMLEYYLNLTDDQIKPNTGRYARICSTTREMYYKAGGTADVGFSTEDGRSISFLPELARCYQEAWNSSRNFLIYAWAVSNL